MPRVHNAINIGSMTASAIQQGSYPARKSSGSQQTIQFSLHVEQVRAAVTAFENAVRITELPAAMLNEIVADLDTIKAQISKSSPVVAIVQEAGKSLRNIVEGVAAGILTPSVIAAAPALWACLRLG